MQAKTILSGLIEYSRSIVWKLTRSQVALYLLLVGAVGAALTLNYLPALVWMLGDALHTGVAAPLAFCLIASLITARKRSQPLIWSFAAVTCIFGLQLIWLWHSGTSETMLVGGFLPFSDPSGYLSAARLLAVGVPFNGIASNRPLATAELAVLWKLCLGNYRLLLLILAAVDSTVAWITMLEVSQLLGFFPAAIWLLIEVQFLQRFVGLPVTEHLGVVFASFGILFGCRAARTVQVHHWMLAAFCLTLSQCIRSGAFLVVPFFLIGAYFASPAGHRKAMLFVFYLSLAVAAAFLLNWFVSYFVIADLRGNGPSNAVYVLHSIVFGGTWADALNRYGGDKVAVWNAVRLEVLKNPSSLVHGGIRSIEAFIRQLYLFCFIGNRWVNAILHLFFLVGSGTAVLGLRTDRRMSWLLFSLVGLLTSILFLPPWDTDAMRAYAATIPIIGLTAALGARFFWAQLVSAADVLLHKPARRFPEIESQMAAIDNCAFILFSSITATCACAPLLLLTLSEGSDRFNSTSYGADAGVRMLDYQVGDSLHLLSDNAKLSRRHIDELKISTFRNGLSSFSALYPGEAALLCSIPGNSILMPGRVANSLVAIDSQKVRDDNANQLVTVRLRSIAQGWLVIDADQELLDRSTQLNSYHTENIGHFGFGVNRVPIIRDGDMITFAGLIETLSQPADGNSSTHTNPSEPFILDRHRIRFPLTGEYHIEINKQYCLKLLVISRASNMKIAEEQIRAFVEGNSNAIIRNNTRFKEPSTTNLANWFESKDPFPMSQQSIANLTAYLVSDLMTP